MIPPLLLQGTEDGYNSELVVLLLSILDSCTTSSNSIRLITLRLTIMLLTELLAGGEGKEEERERKGTSSSEDPIVEGVGTEAGGGVDVATNRGTVLQDHHVALVEHIYESAALRLRLFYKVLDLPLGSPDFVCRPKGSSQLFWWELNRIWRQLKSSVCYASKASCR
jgi:hypothetical protein